VHGEEAKAGLDPCRECHGSARSGGNAGVPCARCHQVFPHPDDFAVGHLKTASERGQAVCMGCHLDGPYGSSTMVARCGALCHLETP